SADGPLTRIDLCDLQIRGEAECLRKTGGTRLTNVLLRNHLDRRGCLGQSFGPSGYRRHLDIHQLIQGQPFQGLKRVTLLPQSGDAVMVKATTRRSRDVGWLLEFMHRLLAASTLSILLRIDLSASAYDGVGHIIRDGGACS